MRNNSGPSEGWMKDEGEGLVHEAMIAHRFYFWQGAKTESQGDRYSIHQYCHFITTKGTKYPKSVVVRCSLSKK